MRIGLVPLVLILIMCGCAADEEIDREPPERDSLPPHEEPAASGRSDALPPGCENLADTILDPRPTRERLRSHFGPADSIAASEQPNRHVPGVIDSIIQVYYPGLEVDIHKPGGGTDLVSQAVVEDDRYLAFPRIGMGAPEDSLLAALGPPTDRAGDMLTYSCGMGADQPVHFELGDDGRVRRIRVDFYVD